MVVWFFLTILCEACAAIMISTPNFTIEKEVDHGDMATVYLAMQDMLNRHVALKVLLPDMMEDENLRKSFLSEGKIITSLDHPNIVRIHDIGIVDETTLIYVDGVFEWRNI